MSAKLAQMFAEYFAAKPSDTLRRRLRRLGKIAAELAFARVEDEALALYTSLLARYGREFVPTARQLVRNGAVSFRQVHAACLDAGLYSVRREIAFECEADERTARVWSAQWRAARKSAPRVRRRVRRAVPQADVITHEDVLRVLGEAGAS